MKRSGVLDELVGKLGQVLPPGAAELKDDFEKNARAAVQSALTKMDLVTREEFDIQAALLQRTREKLDRLEKLVEEQQRASGHEGSD
jgi:BMFP domain-containing protein YqiC